MFALIDILIVRPIVNILFLIYSVVGDFGVAIIIFTIIVKLAMWPLIKKQMAQTRAMREIQPELAKIKKNAKGNRQIESLQTMELYKKKNIKPFSSMLSVFIQLPIFIALFTAINVSVRPCAVNEEYNANVTGTVCATATKENPKTYTVSHSAYPFVRNLNHINTIINQQDTFLKNYSTNKPTEYEFKPKLFGLIDLSQRPGFSINNTSIFILALALVAAFIQYLTMKQQTAAQTAKGAKKKTFKDLMKDAAEGKEADQSEITAMVSGNMMKFMPIMMLFIMVSLPGALILYYLLINIITLFQQRILLSPDYVEKEKANSDIKAIDEQAEKYQAKEAELVKRGTNTNQNKNSKKNITRISASTKKRRKK